MSKLIKQHDDLSKKIRESKNKPVKKAAPTLKSARVDTSIINQAVTQAENTPEYNTAMSWFKKNEKKNFIYPLEITSFFKKSMNDNFYKMVNGNVKDFMKIYSDISKDIIDNNDLKLKVLLKWDKEPKNMSRKNIKQLGNEAKKEGLI